VVIKTHFLETLSESKKCRLLINWVVQKRKRNVFRQKIRVWWTFEKQLLDFQVVSPVALISRMLKMASHVQTAKCLAWRPVSKSAVNVQRDCVRSWNHQRKCLNNGGISCSVRLGAFVTGKAPAKDGRMKFERFFFFAAREH